MMDLLLALALIVAGVPLLTKGADAFVDGAATTAGRFGVPAVVVGAVVLGFGTSLPEAVVSARAAAAGSLDLAVGNVVGSNVANLTLVPGVAGLLAGIPSSRRVRRVLWPMALGATVLLGVLTLDGALSSVDGAVLLAGMVAALAVLLRRDRDATDGRDGDAPAGDPRPTWRLVTVAAAGALGVLAGAELIVAGATRGAAVLGLAEGFVGMTVVALGTSLPELATSVTAARQGQVEMLAGNVLGSNVFNALAVAGLASLAGPAPLVDVGLAYLGLAAAVAVTLAAGMALRHAEVRRPVAVGALVAWAALLPVLA